MKTIVLTLMCLLLFACHENSDKLTQPNTTDSEQVESQPPVKGCTKELKICPDGSGVGRNSSNNCEFDACPEPVVAKKGEPVMCTQEVKQCPDGSFVGRDSNKQCAFKPCPEEAGNLQ